MPKQPSSAFFNTHQLFRFQHLPENRDDLLCEVAERLNERFDLIKIVYYLAIIPPEVYPLQLLPCYARKIGANVFVHDRTSPTQLVAFTSSNILFATLDFGCRQFGMLFLETVVAQPKGLNLQSLHVIATHIAQYLYYLDQTQPAGDNSYQPPAVIFDDDLHQVWVEGQAIHLSEKERLLLKYLYKHAGQPCRRRDLLSTIYAEEADEVTTLDRRLDKLVTRLRAKLKQASRGRLCLETVRSVGYQLQW